MAKLAGATWIKRLESLECPYIEDVDESWATDLICKPGEARIRLLQWLFSRLDPDVEELLDNHSMQMTGHGDSRLKSLLYIASSLGLCGSDEIELIKGTCPLSRQRMFMNSLIDLVYIVDQNEREGNNQLEKKFTSNCQLMDKICHGENMKQVFLTNINLFPHDLTHIARSQDSKEITEKDYNDLMESASKIADQLVERQNQLAHLKSSYSPAEYDMNKIRPLLRRLKLTLSTLSQIMAGFSHCYETEIKSWCQKPSPKLSALGLVVKRIDNLLAHVSQTLTDVRVVKDSYDRLNDGPAKPTQASTHEDQESAVKDLDHVKRSVNILEQSISRVLTNYEDIVRSVSDASVTLVYRIWFKSLCSVLPDRAHVLRALSTAYDIRAVTES